MCLCVRVYLRYRNLFNLKERQSVDLCLGVGLSWFWVLCVLEEAFFLLVGLAYDTKVRGGWGARLMGVQCEK